MRGMRFGAVLAASLWMGVSATADEKIPPHYRPPSDSVEAGLWMTSDALEADLKTSPLRIRDARLETYVRGVVCKLIPQRCEDVRLYILDMPYFNAAMMPNGAIQVWSGLLLRTQNEAQLASVLGHEITHYTHRHALNGWGWRRSTAGMLNVLKIALRGADATVRTHFRHFTNVADVLALASVMSYSRDEEREADAGGFALMTQAGYRAQDSYTVWMNRLAEEAKSAPAAFTDDHPSSAERMTALQKLAAGHVGGETGAEAFHFAVQPYRLAWMREDIGLGQYDRSLALLGIMEKETGETGVMAFCRGEIYRRRALDGDDVRAASDYRSALAQPGAPAEAWRGLGLIERRLGHEASAQEAFRRYLAAAPNADDRAMIESYLGSPLGG